YNTGAKDGNGVAYNKKKDEIYQVGRSQKIIYTFSNASTAPTLKQTITDASLSSGREIAYDETRDILYVANNTDSTIRRYQSFSALSGEVTGEVLKITGQPWGIAYEPTTDRLVVLIDQTAMRLDVFDAPSTLAAGSITANRSINVTNRPNNVKSRLHGLSIDMKNNLLVVTEIGEAAAPVIVDTTKPAFNADGGIYVFRKAQTLLSTGGTVAADALIYGSNTGLGNPVDVQVRDINGKTYILACEKANKKILVFHVNANGNAFPASTTITTYAPEDMCAKQ
ncbi:MAG TPA: hypothetical protein PL045_01930, partial [Chitinophagaceae bacterium]|nr:hypothetical protein [Chitinophagaceae bacterium]